MNALNFWWRKKYFESNIKHNSKNGEVVKGIENIWNWKTFLLISVIVIIISILSGIGGYYCENRKKIRNTDKYVIKRPIGLSTPV